MCEFTLTMPAWYFVIAVLGFVCADMQGLHQDYMTRGKWDGDYFQRTRSAVVVKI